MKLSLFAKAGFPAEARHSIWDDLPDIGKILSQRCGDVRLSVDGYLSLSAARLGGVSQLCRDFNRVAASKGGGAVRQWAEDRTTQKRFSGISPDSS
jgi:hypothetical protein